MRAQPTGPLTNADRGFDKPKMPLPLYVGSSRLAHQAAAKSVVVLWPST